jgi:putative NADPH-quinone reductase
MHIVVIDGHPDPAPSRFCHALANAYAEGAESAGNTVKRLTVAEIDVPILRSQHEWDAGTPTQAIRACQKAIGWAEHLVIIYPLWLGTMPALLKALLEQVFRPGFPLESDSMKKWPKVLKGKSARIVITMGMPAFIYRWYFLAHSLRSLERNTLRFVGIGPISETLIGSMGSASAKTRQKHLDAMRGLGRQGR